MELELEFEFKKDCTYYATGLEVSVPMQDHTGKPNGKPVFEQRPLWKVVDANGNQHYTFQRSDGVQIKSVDKDERNDIENIGIIDVMHPFPPQGEDEHPWPYKGEKEWEHVNYWIRVGDWIDNGRNGFVMYLYVTDSEEPEMCPRGVVQANDVTEVATASATDHVPNHPNHPEDSLDRAPPLVLGSPVQVRRSARLRRKRERESEPERVGGSGVRMYPLSQRPRPF